MSASNPRYYKWYPTEETDLGTMPFEGDFTTDDKITQMSLDGVMRIYTSNASGTEFGRYVQKKVGNRIKSVWEPGVTVGPITHEGIQMPVWFCYCGDGVCTVKLPNGEQPEPYEPTEG